jgi:hypothetical protein
LMLRYSFLPSDYHPMVLMLGEARDMPALIGLLESFGRSPRDMELCESPGFAMSDTRIALVHCDEDEQLGMHLLSRKEKILRWRLDASTALLFAEMVGELGSAGIKSGSEQLACGDYRAIPVKVSRGEFTDDYLVFGGARDR